MRICDCDLTYCPQWLPKLVPLGQREGKATSSFEVNHVNMDPDADTDIRITVLPNKHYQLPAIENAM